MHFGRTGCTADPWRCAALSYKLHFHLLLTEKTNNVTPMLHCKVNTRNELHRGVAQGASTSITGAAPSR